VIKQKEDYSFRKPVGIHLSQVRHILSELFIGRISEIDKITKALHSNNTSQDQRRLVLGGMGGVGKIQLAIAYAKSGRGSYSSVFWLNAVSEATLKESFLLIASYIFDVEDPRALKDEELVRRVRQWLSDSTNTSWLLIFNNYEDPDQF
jgi:hypothetical protein